MSGDQEQAMRHYLQRIATGPALSKDLTQAEARHGMELILEDRVDRVQAALFLIALRMKRETVAENQGILDALRAATDATEIPVADLVELGDPYDGFTRHLPATPFLPAVLAACGIPCVSHGVTHMGPKFGVTHHRILAAAGQPVDLSPAAAAARLTDPARGWAYVDQAQATPALHRLQALRTTIVKRPCLATLEKLVGPVRAQRNHLVVGYVHKPYPPLLTTLAQHAGYYSALVVRGVEGGVCPLLNTAVAAHRYRGETDATGVKLNPVKARVHSDVRAVPLPSPIKDADAIPLDSLAQAAVEAGQAALQGAPGPTRDSLVYTAAVILWHMGAQPEMGSAAEQVRAVLDNGAAWARWQCD